MKIISINNLSMKKIYLRKCSFLKNYMYSSERRLAGFKRCRGTPVASAVSEIN